MTEVDLMLVGCGVMAEPHLTAAARHGLRVAVVAPASVRPPEALAELENYYAAEHQNGLYAR